MDVASVLGVEAIGCEYSVTMTSGDQKDSDCSVWCVGQVDLQEDHVWACLHMPFKFIHVTVALSGRDAANELARIDLDSARKFS